MAAMSVMSGVVMSSFLRAEPMMIADDPHGRRDEIIDCVDRVVLHLFKVSCNARLLVPGYNRTRCKARCTRLVARGELYKVTCTR